MRPRRHIANLAACLVLAACGGGGSDPPPTAPPVAPAPPPPSPPAAAGLAARPANATCLAPARPTLPAALEVTRVFPALALAAPVGLLQAPRDSSRWFVIEQGGVVRSFDNGDTTTTTRV